MKNEAHCSVDSKVDNTCTPLLFAGSSLTHDDKDQAGGMRIRNWNATQPLCAEQHIPFQRDAQP